MTNSMKAGLAAIGGLVLLAGGGALAQSAAPPPPPGTDQPGPRGGPGGAEDMHGPGHGHGRMGEMMRMHRRMPPPTKAAFFQFRKGDATVTIKCADDEPIKACVDAGAALLDKLAALPR